MKIIDLSHSGYTDGLGHGTTNRNFILAEVETTSLEAMQKDGDRLFSEIPSLRYRIQKIKTWDSPQVDETYSLFHRLKLDSFPGATAFPELKGAVEWWRDWVRGVAAATNLREIQVIRHRYWRELQPYFYEWEPDAMNAWLDAGGKLPLPARADREPQTRCTGIVMADTEDGRLIGNSWDDAIWWAEKGCFGEDGPILMVNRRGGYNVVSASGHLVNETGLALTCVGGAPYAQSPPLVRFPVPDGVDLLVTAGASTTQEALEIYRRYCQFQIGNSNHVIMDRFGVTAVLESVRVASAARVCERGRAFTTYIGVSDPQLLAGVTSSPQQLAYYRGRMDRLGHHLEADPGPLSHRRMREAQCDHEGWAHVCQHHDRLPPKEKQPNGEEHEMIGFVTLRHVVGELDRRRYASYSYRDGQYPCQVPPKWHDYCFQP